MKALKVKLMLVCICMLAIFNTRADSSWSQFSLQYLTSHEYLDVTDNSNFTGSVLTLEHAANYNWGKSFLFIDRLKQSGQKSNDETYMELGLDFSLNHLLGRPVSSEAIKNIYWVVQWEQSNVEKGFENYLYGLGLGWDIPGFIYFDTKLYHRSNASKSSNFQVSTSWSYPFTVSQYQFYFDGFIDIESKPEGSTYLIKSQPQLKLDVGKLFQTDNQYFIGIEIEILRNKFGVKNKNQFAPQFLIQANF